MHSRTRSPGTPGSKAHWFFVLYCFLVFLHVMGLISIYEEFVDPVIEGVSFEPAARGLNMVACIIGPALLPVFEILFAYWIWGLLYRRG